MFGNDPIDLAVRGEVGIDVFHRQDLPDQGRSRYRCLGTVRPGAQAPDIHEPDAVRRPERLLRAAAALERETTLTRPFALVDATGFADLTTGGGDPIILFLRIDFLRAWALADLGLTRLREGLATDPAAVFARRGHLASQVALAYDFNRLSVGVDLAHQILAALPQSDVSDDGTAFALRMLGDLALRAGDPSLALSAFERALAIGQNPHRQARALAAAQALGDPDAIARHSPRLADAR